MDNCILYELLVYCEWKEEQEFKCSKQSDDVKSNVELLLRYLKSIFQSVTYKEIHDDSVFRLINSQLPWQFAVGQKGKVVAIMQNDILEIRTSRDEYSSVVGKAAIFKDPYPQWRKLEWSPDCSMLACAHSNGVVGFYDLLGSNIFNIYPKKYNEQVIFSDTKHSFVSLIFLDIRVKSPKWSYELITVDITGILKSYLVSPMDGYQEYHTYSFSRSYIGGVTDVVYHPAHNLLYVVGSSNILDVGQPQDQGSKMGISAWRLLNDYPYYKLSKSTMDEDDDGSHHVIQSKVWSWIPHMFRKKQSDIFKIKVSPQGQLMVCLHTSGSISIWQLPSMRLYRYWELSDQHNYDVKNSHFPNQRRGNTFSVSESILFHPVDVNWWSEQAIIIARYSGSISVCSIDNLQNLLGDLPEFFDGQPRVSAMCDKGFLGLECVCTVSSIKKRLIEDEHNWEELSYSAESSEDEDGSLIKKGTSLIKTGLYWVTDSEQFRPKRKRPKLVRRIYRLLGLKSTTPEELYARKLDNEEYGEALALAQAYNLDCDLVYQRQWRNSNVTLATIHDYLGKVTKRLWVLKECVSRVPDTFDAAEKLLKFGLRETGLDVVEFLIEGYEELEVDPTNSPKKADLQKTQVRLSPKPDAEDELTDEEKWEQCLHNKVKKFINKQELMELVHYRRILLQCMDKLKSYKIILKEQKSNDSQYNASFYEKFRSSPVMNITLEFARQGDSASVENMFTYHGDAILDHWLVILSNFPETADPLQYSTLLPECTPDGKVFPWDQKLIRDPDWCECEDLMQGGGQSMKDRKSTLLEEDKGLLKFVSSPLTPEGLAAWYSERACQIETRSKMVDHAITLVKLGRERNVLGLDILHGELLTLETLVYEVGMENISLSDVQKKTNLEKAQLLMQKTTESSFVRDMKYLLMPFLVRCEKESKGSLKQLLHDYLIDISSKDLRLPLQLFIYFGSEKSESFLSSLDDRTTLALDCLYAYPEADQLDIAFKILECLPERGFGSKGHRNIDLQERVDELESHLSCAEIFQRNGILMPLTYIRQVQYDHDTVYGLLVKLSRSIIKKSLSATQVEWNYLLNDIMDLQAKAFSIINFETCIEVYVSALLSSGLGANIKNASEYLQCSKDMGCSKRVSYDRSVQLILKSAREYFDSSGDVHDPSMNLAKSCLQLILDQDNEIEEELDLIEALHILSEFGVKMLPLQVRLFPNRIKLVENCLNSNPDAYKRSVSLLKLAKTLHVEDDDHRVRDGKVLSLIAEKALEVKDFKCCVKVCQNIMDQSYGNGWEIAQKLGRCPEFHDLKLKIRLVSFALLHCDPHMIEPLVKLKCSIDVQIQNEYMANKFSKEKTPDRIGGSVPITSAHQREESNGQASFYQTLTVSAENVKERTTAILKGLGGETVWKNTLSWIRPIQDYTSSENEEDLNEDFTKQGYDPFYATLHPDCHLSILGTKYNKYSSPDLSNTSLELLQILSRINLLQESNDDSSEVKANRDVIVKLSELLLPEDCVLGMAYLLALGNPKLADNCFSELEPKTEVSLQLAMLYFSLQIAVTSAPPEKRHDMYLHDPNKLFQYVYGLKSNLSDSNKYCMERLEHYHSLLIDHLQERLLSSMGYGVHVQRFSSDSEYQQDTIVGLALTDDSAAFQFAMDLAARHHVPEGKLVAAYVSTIFISDRLSLKELKSRISDPKLVEKMKAAPDNVINSLNTHVYPLLDGKDYEKLNHYFLTLEMLMENGTSWKPSPANNVVLSPSEHLKLLKSVVATNSGIDYKELIDNPNDILKAVSPRLTINNLESIANLLKGLHPSLNCSVQVGNLYGLWVKKYFFQEMDNASHASGQEVKWQEKFQQCKAYFYKMLPFDILDFVKEACFSEKSHKLLTIECRKWMINSTESFCKLQCSMNDWSLVANEISKWKMHLKKLSTKAALDVYSSGSEDLKNFLRLLDLAHVDDKKVFKTFKLAVCSSEPFSSIEFLLSLSVSEYLQPISCLLEEFLKVSVKDFIALEDSSDHTSKQEAVAFVEAVLSRLQEGFDGGVVFDLESSLWKDLQMLCASMSLTPTLRLQALKLIQEHYIHDQCDSENTEELEKKLLLYETQAIVAKCWISVEVKFSDLEKEESRSVLFNQLLESTKEWTQVHCLSAVLERWPKFQGTHDDVKTNPWVSIIKNMDRFTGQTDDDIYQFVENVFTNHHLEEKDVDEALSEMEQWNNYPVLVHSLLLLEGGSFHEKAIDIILNMSQEQAFSLKRSTLSLIIRKKLVTHIVGSKIFNDCIQQILDCKEEDNSLINEVIEELKTSGKVAEAGILSLQSKYVPKSLQVFSSALSIMYKP
ncbi:neuroblastoma-amplified sequence-like [Ischnura elegans]|uniref:neuroblastoma-amplified sequence-like n=1 Tax=Ischnura elegans TaxID=197161 RepID=UPI001ED8982D|nr:neuroblastoma-amplified sequence-like [Ischnura elegans]